ncbi:hypothetical protein B566_EDAN009165 [Ephemera danica]|nr:hypothetical protein B566_EDAN009165 [Ephemera danica]
MTRVSAILVLVALCCLAALAAASPLKQDARRTPAYRRSNVGLRRRAPRPSSLYAARSHDAPAYAAPEDAPPAEDEPASALSGEDVQQDAPVDEPIARPGRARRPASSEDDGGAPPAYGNQPRTGTNAIATSYSRGDDSRGLKQNRSISFSEPRRNDDDTRQPIQSK